MYKTPETKKKPKKTLAPSIPIVEPIVQVEFRNTILNKVIHYEGHYITTCGQAILIKLFKQEGNELNPKLACMIYDKELNANLNPAARLQQILELFQKVATIRGFQTVGALAEALMKHDIYLAIPKMGGVFKAWIHGRLYEDPGFLFEFFEESYGLDDFINRNQKILTSTLKSHLIYQLLTTYLIIFDNPHSEIKFVHNDLFPANLLIFTKNWQFNLVIIDWAGGGFYNKKNMQFLSTPLVYGRPAYTNILIPYEMNPNHHFFHATTDYFSIASLIFFIISGGENPLIFLRNISERKILDLIERLEPLLTPYVMKKEKIPYAFPPGPEEWKELYIEDLIRTQNRNDAIIIIRNVQRIIKEDFPGLDDLFYRSFVLGYKNPKVRPAPFEYYECLESHLGKANIAEFIDWKQIKFVTQEPPIIDTVPFSLPSKELRPFNKSPEVKTDILSKIQNVMKPEVSKNKNFTITSPIHPPAQVNNVTQRNRTSVEDLKAKMKDIFQTKKKSTPGEK